MISIATGHSNGRPIVSVRHVLFLAVAVRLLLPLLAIIITGGNALFHAQDTNSYVRPAVALISEGRFDRNDEPEINRTPGYPILLIPGIALGYVELITIILQITLSALTVYLVYKITLLLFERSDIAILSAFLYALEPLSILYSSKLLSETLFTTLIAIFLYFLVRYWKKGSLALLVASATALAASVYVRPIAYYLPILVFVILFIWVLATDRKNSTRLVYLGVFLLTSIGLIGIWQIRNKIETGYPGFSAAAEESLYYWDAASVLAVANGIPIDEMKNQMGFYDEEIYFRKFPNQRGWERSEILRSMGKEGLAIILNNPATYSVLVSNGILRTLLDPGATEYLRMFRLYPEAGGLVDLFIERGLISTIGFLIEEMPLVFWANLLLGPLLVSYLLLAVLGLVRCSRALPMPMVLFSGLIAYFLVLSAVGIGIHRARHPIMPIICILAGYGLFRIASILKRKSFSNQAKLIPIS